MIRFSSLRVNAALFFCSLNAWKFRSMAGLSTNPIKLTSRSESMDGSICALYTCISMRVGIKGAGLFHLESFCIFRIKLISYMRYLLTILMFAFVSCDKDKNDTKPAPEPPTITKIDVSSETVAGVARPKFTITLNVPDESSVLLLQIFQNAQFPTTESGKVVNPKSGVYTVIDMTAT